MRALSPVVLGLSSPTEHRSAGPSVLPPQRFYERLREEIHCPFLSCSLAAVPPTAPPVAVRLLYGSATKLLRSNCLVPLGIRETSSNQ